MTDLKQRLTSRASRACSSRRRTISVSRCVAPAPARLPDNLTKTSPLTVRARLRSPALDLHLRPVHRPIGRPRHRRRRQRPPRRPRLGASSSFMPCPAPLLTGPLGVPASPPPPPADRRTRRPVDLPGERQHDPRLPQLPRRRLEQPEPQLPRLLVGLAGRRLSAWSGGGMEGEGGIMYRDTRTLQSEWSCS